MTRDDMKEIARGNIESNLSDAAAEDGVDALYDTAYTLAFDALSDAGVDHLLAGEIATEVAQGYAQP